MVAAAGFFQRGGCEWIAMEGETGGARAVCGPRQSALTGAVNVKAAKEAAASISRTAVTTGSLSSKRKQQQTPQPVAHPNPPSWLPGFLESLDYVALQIELANDAAAAADSGNNSACAAITQATKNAQALCQLK